MNKYVETITKLFPTWSKIYKDPENSEGGKFIKAFSVFLLNIEDIIHDILAINNLSTNIVDYDGYQLSKIDFVGKTEIKKEILDNADKIWVMIDNEKVEVNETESTFLFFFEKDPLYYYDNDEGILYLNTISDLYIDGSQYSILPHHVWGPYDEIGLLINCERQPLEKNPTYVYRLREAWSDFANSSPEKLKRFIIRSLIPYGASLDDKIEFIELTDSYMNKVIEEEGLSDKLKSYIEQSKRVNHNFDNSYWSIIETNNKGLKFLPISWNNSLYTLNKNDIQSGVISEGDLEIGAPDLINSTIDANFDLYVTKKTQEENKVYKETDFNYTISNKKLVEGIKNQDANIEIKQSENINLEFDLIAQIAYETVTSIYFTQDGSDILTNYHVENDKEEDIALDFSSKDENNSDFDFSDSTEVLPLYEGTADTVEINAKLISENNSTPVLDNIVMVFNENGEEIEHILTSNIIDFIENKTANGIAFENEHIELQDGIYAIDIDDYEIQRGKTKDIKIIRDGSENIGFSL